MVFPPREVISTGKVTTQERYYISSLDVEGNDFNTFIRSHWGIENKLHWSLDTCTTYEVRV